MHGACLGLREQLYEGLGLYFRGVTFGQRELWGSQDIWLNSIT